MIVHGQEIQPIDVELATVPWNTVRFAALCNNILWAETRRQTGAIPKMTGRVFVADKGEDAEWVGRAVRGGRKSGQFLRPGTNVFQYKKRTVSQTDRRRIVQRLKADVRAAIAKVEERTGKTVTSYVLFTNVDMTIEEQEAVERAIRWKREGAHAVIMCAAPIAAALNDLQHLRSAHFVTSGFRTWEEAWRVHASTAIPGATIDLTGRDDLIGRLANWTEDQESRALILTGPHSIGKTRLALEATKERRFDFVEATDRNATLVTDLLQLNGSTGEVIICIDDPEPQTAQRLVSEVLAQPRLKLILTVPTSDAVALPSFGIDDRVSEMRVEPLGDEDARHLVHTAGDRLDYGLETWIIGMAGGVPGILLAAATVGRELREHPGNFVSQVASALEVRLRSRLTEREFFAIQLFSCLSFVGVEGDPQGEARTICDIFGANLHGLLSSINPLCATGLLRHRGSYVEVAPPLLANHLAAWLFHNHVAADRALFDRLESASVRRFLRRMIQLSGPAVDTFWNSLVQSSGPFGSFDQLVDNAALFHGCAAALPAWFAGQVADQLANAPLEIRLGISGDARRDLVWGLEQFLLRSDTSESALRALGELAEAENENIGNNATGEFSAAFHPNHSQIPLALARRFLILQMLFSETAPETQILLGLRACETALRRTLTVGLTPSVGGAPVGTMPTMTWGEYWQYQRDVLALIKEATKDARETVRRRAKRLLPSAAENLIAPGTFEHAVEALEYALAKLLAGDFEFDASDLTEALWRSKKNLNQIAAAQPDHLPDLESHLERLTGAREQLGNAPYVILLRQLVGGWSFLDDDDDAPGTALELQSARIEDLAQIACTQPELLDEGTVDWLLSPDVQRAGEFWFSIGRHDISGHWATRVQDVAKYNNAALAIQNFLNGWKSRDAVGAATWFTNLVVSSEVAPRTILYGSVAAESPDDAAKRVIELLRTQAVEPRLVAGVLGAPRWLERVSDGSLLGVLSELAGPEFEGAGLVFELFAFRLHLRSGIQQAVADFLWRCLEARPTLPNHNDEYRCEELAARLSKLDPERGFALLELILRSPYKSGAWDPLWGGPRHKFWEALRRVDRVRALIVVLDAAKDQESLHGGQLIGAAIDPEVDRDILLDFASRGENEAGIVAGALLKRPAGFWPLAFALVERFPHSGRVLSALSFALMGLGGSFWGSMSSHLEQSLAEAERALAEGASGPLARAWLEEQIRALNGQIKEHRRDEADRRIDW